MGAEIKYIPISKKDQARCHEFGDKTLPGIFFGYHQKKGGKYSGDVYIVDWEQMAEADYISQVHVKRFKASEVIPTKID